MKHSALQMANSSMNPSRQEHWREFARRYVAQGRAEGRAAFVIKLLATRFGPLSVETETRIEGASVAELDAIGERLLTAPTLRAAIDPPKYEYQSEFAREHIAQGRAEGRAAMLIRLLSIRFGLSPYQAEMELQGKSIEELDAIGERLLTAQTLEEALGSR